MSKEDESNAEPLTSRFVELWGEAAATVAMLATIIRICENAPFNDDLQGDLESVIKIAGEGLATFGKDDDDNKPAPGFGFSKE